MLQNHGLSLLLYTQSKAVTRNGLHGSSLPLTYPGSRTEVDPILLLQHLDETHTTVQHAEKINGNRMLSRTTIPLFTLTGSSTGALHMQCLRIRGDVQSHMKKLREQARALSEPSVAIPTQDNDAQQQQVHLKLSIPIVLLWSNVERRGIKHRPAFHAWLEALGRGGGSPIA